MSEHLNPDVVKQLVEDVSNWYTEQIMKERAAGPDSERLKELKEQWTACATDLQALQDADADEVAEIAARYAARAQELDGQ
ncbi:hypothetical protein [Streptomyces sp. NPDC092307]|uniref:hypothetical protein n=1 Tax=Streptomyces sp. NPDC092307 TaxID=3366013 RepID=UPI0038058CE0